MKKKACLILVLIIAIASLCGCSNNSDKKLTYEDYDGWTIEIKNLWEKNTTENYVLNLQDVLYDSSNKNLPKIVINYPCSERCYDIYSVICYKNVPQGRYHIVYEVSYFDGEKWIHNAPLQKEGKYYVRAKIMDWENLEDLYCADYHGYIEIEVKITKNY